MPGLSLLFDIAGTLQKERSVIRNSLQAVLHDSDYEINYHIESCNFLLVSTCHKEYPVTCYDDGQYRIVIEGQIYEKYSSIQSKIREIIPALFSGDCIRAELEIDQWLQSNDGDFILFVLDKKNNEAVIINDALGRLPLYIFNNDSRLILSRELQFVYNLIPEKKFNRMGIAQYLMFGYSLGERTIIENVYRAAPCLFLKISLNRDKSISLRYCRRYNFEKREYNRLTIDENAAALEKIFLEACKNRVNPDKKCLVGLSGGLDSRSVAASLKKLQLPFTAVTRLSCNNAEKSDAEIAEIIAKFLNVEWILYKNEQLPKGFDLFQIIKRKSGLNNISLNFMVHFLGDIVEKNGRKTIYFTGDGGMMLKYLKPVQRLKNIEALVKYTLANNQVMSINTVSVLTSIPEKVIFLELKEHLKRYPESDLNQKYNHFMVCEHGFRWSFEGEDRNRSYLWSVTPFYSIHFFTYATNCPDNQKIFFKLYHRFMSKLSGDIVSIDNAKWRAPIGSRKAFLTVRKAMAVKKYQKLSNLYRVMFKRKKDNIESTSASIIKCMAEQAKNCQAVGELINISYIMNNLSFFNRQQLDAIFTVTSAIEFLEKGKSTLQNYCQRDFG